MITNKFVEILSGILLVISLPVQIVTTFVLGLLVSVSFGLLLIPISIVWIVIFFAPLIANSYIYEKAKILRIPVSIIGTPFAILGYHFCSLMPAMGEKGAKASKMLLCSSFPYTWHCHKLSLAKSPIHLSKGFPNLLQILNNISPKDRVTWDYAFKIKETYNLSWQLNSI